MSHLVDAELRKLERVPREDHPGQARLLRARLRVGTVTDHEIDLWAEIGDPGSRLLRGWCCPKHRALVKTVFPLLGPSHPRHCDEDPPGAWLRCVLERAEYVAHERILGEYPRQARRPEQTLTIAMVLEGFRYRLPTWETRSQCMVCGVRCDDSRTGNATYRTAGGVVVPCEGPHTVDLIGQEVVDFLDWWLRTPGSHTLVLIPLMNRTIGIHHHALRACAVWDGAAISGLAKTAQDLVREYRQPLREVMVRAGLERSGRWTNTSGV